MNTIDERSIVYRRSNRTMKSFIGPTLGNDRTPILFALDSDESFVTKSQDEWTSHERAEDTKYVRENSCFTLSVLILTKPSDGIIIDERFKNKQLLLNWLIRVHRCIGFNNTSHIFFAKPKTFARLASQRVHQDDYPIVSIIGYSSLLGESFSIEPLYSIARKLNAKTSLPRLAQTYGFPIPASAVLPMKRITSDELKKFGFPDHTIYVKSDGLGGGSNVCKIASPQDVSKAHNLFPSEDLVLVQQAIGDGAIETITTFLIYPHRVMWINTRAKLVYKNIWYGNVYLPDLAPSPQQMISLLAAAEAVRASGYHSSYGLLVGFDAFLQPDNATIIEMNARWLGSTPSEQVLYRLGLLDKVLAVGIFDTVVAVELEVYKQFCEEHLFQRDTKEVFQLIPLSFSAYNSRKGESLVHFLVIGDFRFFAAEIKKRLPRSFPLLQNTLDIYTRVIDTIEKIKGR